MRVVPYSLPSALSILFTACLLAGTHSPALAIWPNPDAGRPLSISAATGDQLCASACPDGSGGAIVTWNDSRNPASSWDIYVQRVDASGKTRWTAEGVPICTAQGGQNLPRVTEDGVGGAFITWYDSRTPANAEDIYAQHVNANGTPLWTANGIAVCAMGGTQIDPRIVPDGSGGVFIVWADARGAIKQVYGQHVNAAGTLLWTSGGTLLSPGSTVGLDNVEAAADGVGGLCVAWKDLRYAPSIIAMTHVDGSGSPTWSPAELLLSNPAGEAPAVASDGHGGMYVGSSRSSMVVVTFMSADGIRNYDLAVSPGVTSTQFSGAVMTADGLGGVIVSWFDGATRYRLAQRVGPGGTLLWPAPVPCSVSDGQLPAIVADGSGGATLCDFIYVAGRLTLAAVHVGRTGTSDWPGGWSGLESTAIYSARIAATSDGAGGVIAAWDEGGFSTGYNIQAQRLDGFGYGGAEPGIVRVKDVRNDQGGLVELQWNASRLDLPGDSNVADYSIWRQVPVLAAQAALRQGAALLADGEARPAGAARALRTTGTAASAVYWEYVGQQPSRGLATYSYLAPTASDSVPGSNPLTKFMVMAEHNPPTLYWSSAPDSGYSVDNLPPGPPAPVAIAYRAGTSYVHWSPVVAPDLAGYRVYRGASSSFTPSPANLVGAPADTGFADAGSSLTQWYKLSAVDIHGNESAFVTAQPWSTTGVEPALPASLALRGAFPNPARGGSVIRYALPAAGRVNLAILDLAGRRVRTLAAGDVPAGEQAAAWDGRDASGRPAAPGLYFVRLEVAGRVLQSRLSVLE